MTDMEKAIKGLKCLADENSVCHSDCPYFTDREEGAFCFRKMAHDALELLKEQPQKAHWVKMHGMMPPEFTGHFECDNCGWHGKLNERETDYSFCPGCGAKMSVGTPTIDEIDCSNPLLDEVIDMLEYIAYMRGITIDKEYRQPDGGSNTNKQNEKEK